MKYIFDFDDTLFLTSKKFKKYIFIILNKAGISHELVKDYFQKEEFNLFSLKKMLKYFSAEEEVYENIMNETKNFINEGLIKTIKKLGKENCYIVTYGDEEFQRDKIERAKISPLFSEIIVVGKEYKKEAIEKICGRHKDEEVVFIDDKQKHFDELDMSKCPNLKTILYAGQDIKPLLLP
ncbi:MAG TPA: HAD hydrolase-like protein [Candidatus Paceibacterota bacterium]|jgi:FMN phosphatase YigB (HAD superfamily)|nr:HAD hydrolase-like protein [Candidatus Paceibacterota bacterium]